MANISVIVVCLNEEFYIGKCIDSLLAQDYRKNFLEIIIVDGNSSDRTLEIARSYIHSKPRVSVVVEHKLGTAAARNRGIREAHSELVAFIDGDCIAPSDWLSTLVNAYQEEKQSMSNVAGVGGRNVPPSGADNFLLGVEISLNTYIGSFSSSQGRQFQMRRRVESIATLNALYDKSTLETIGLFDESLGSEGEDAELNFRLRKKGYELVFIPEAIVYHFLRSSPKLWFQNMFRYGKARARLLKRHKDMWSFQYFLPPLFGVIMLSVLFAPLNMILLLPLCYFPLIMLYSISIALKQSAAKVFLSVFTAYVSEHFGYASGMIYGLTNRRVC
jgi:glycosyltransferase involved in cell wall biosynthesis